MFLGCWLIHHFSIIVAVLQSLTCVQHFVTPWTAARQASLSITISWGLTKFKSIALVMPSSHLFLTNNCLHLFVGKEASIGVSLSVSLRIICCCCLVTNLCHILLQPHGLVAHQSPLSMGFPRQEYWSGLPFPSPGDLPDPGIELSSPALIGRFFTTVSPGKLFKIIEKKKIDPSKVVLNLTTACNASQTRPDKHEVLQAWHSFWWHIFAPNWRVSADSHSSHYSCAPYINSHKMPSGYCHSLLEEWQ